MKSLPLDPGEIFLWRFASGFYKLGLELIREISMEDLMRKIITLASILFMLTAAACERGEIVKDQFSYGDLKNLTPEKLKPLSQKRVFFGHQSVGNNIMDGIQDILKENPQIRLSIIASDKPEVLLPGTFEHFNIGKNEDPDSKINAFSKLICEGTGDRADIAFIKFCYVDITASTDVEALFKRYNETMAGLKKDYPNVTFVHFTVPLLNQPAKSLKSILKSSLKKLIGKGGDGFYGNSHNIARHRYNELIKVSYEGKEPVFDLARLESIAPDGTVSSFNENGLRILSLCPAYTEDGGHLNDTGRRVIAQQLMLFLAGLK
jgi:hypothetical protein